MAARAPNIDNYKLDTKFGEGYVTHTAGIGQRGISGVAGTWKQKKRIGQGGFGSVWLQEEAITGTQRAVKKILRENTRKKDLLQELRALVEVKHFQRLFVQFFGWYENSDFLFIAMEYVEHGDLGGYLARSGPKPEAEGKVITRQVLEGLAFLHGRNICHRDLKPQNLQNVLITSIFPIRIKLTDFGVSKCAKGTSLMTRLGTPAYQAPELLDMLPRKLRPNNKIGYTNAIDLWSLGCLVQYILTLETPFLEAPNTDYTDIDELGIVDSGIGNSMTGDSDDSDSDIASAPTRQTDWKLFAEFCSGGVDLPTVGLQRFCVSEKGTEFVKKLLVADPRSRISAAGALEHKWFLEFSDGRELPPIGSRNRPFRNLPDFDDLLLESIPFFSRMKYKPPSPPPRLQASPRNLGTQLVKAAGLGNLETVRNLLAHKADITKRDELGQTSLMKATLHGNTELVELLLEKGADLNIVDNDGHSVLHCAALNGREEILELLLGRGVDLGVVDTDRNSGLHYAAFNGHLGVVRLLLEKEVDLNVADSRGRSPLHLAAFGGHGGVVNLLLDGGADLSMMDSTRASALHYSILGGHINTVEMLLEGGADLGAVNNHGESVLYLAVTSGEEMVKFLLDRGANLGVVANDGRSVLYTAALAGNEEVVKLLLERGADPTVMTSSGATLFHAAACSGNEQVVKLLLERGADASVVNNMGDLVLEAAAIGGNKSIVEMFLGGVADLSEVGGGTPMAVAAAIMFGQEEIVKLLAQREEIVKLLAQREEIVKLLPRMGPGISAASKDDAYFLVRYAAFQGLEGILEVFLEKVDSAVVDDCRHSALHLAALKGYGGIVKRLLRRGADLSAVDNYGASVLHYAALQGHEKFAELVRPDIGIGGNTYPALRPTHLGCHEEVVQLLLDRGADPNIVDNTGISVLHCATLIGDEGVVKLLLERGADLNVVNSRKISALHYAALQGHAEIVELFLERGADLCVVDDRGYTVLHYAALQGREEVVELLLERRANEVICDEASELDCAALNGRPDLVQDFLREMGLDNSRYPVIRPTDLNGHAEIVKLFLGVLGEAAGGKYILGSRPSNG